MIHAYHMDGLPLLYKRRYNLGQSGVILPQKQRFPVCFQSALLHTLPVHFLHCKDDVLVCSAYVWYNYRKYKVVSLISGRSVQQNLYKVHNSDIQRNVCIDSGIEQSKIYIQLRFWNKMPGLHKDYNFYYERS